MSVKIRSATAADAAPLTACMVAAYAPFLHLGLPPVTEGIAEDIGNHTVLVAEATGVLLGGVVLVLNEKAHIANLAVHPDAGGQGVGKALIAAAIAAAEAAGHAEICLATHAGMAATQAFYRKTGWVETGRDGQKVYFAKQLK